jgi:hypothetical protein
METHNRRLAQRWLKMWHILDDAGRDGDVGYDDENEGSHRIPMCLYAKLINPKRRFPFDGSRFTVPAFQTLLLPLAVFSEIHCDDQEVSVRIIHRLEAFVHRVLVLTDMVVDVDKHVQTLSRYRSNGTMVEDARRENAKYIGDFADC